MNAFRLTAGVMMFGSMTYKQKPREEQAEVESVDGRSLYRKPQAKNVQRC